MLVQGPKWYFFPAWDIHFYPNRLEVSKVKGDILKNILSFIFSFFVSAAFRHSVLHKIWALKIYHKNE